ncbi:poly(R)-hydroxyalkanoic acid synthase subunit PhaE [Nitrosopumilus sp.]|uniref:poly(R)-hydroxyalkanoic acid synthase subunit PhaE n=1 Tax=Nitrosopumilus sp. TaxID=2024843 RepID=UPI003D0ED085
MQSESTKDITDYYKHLSLFWTDIVHLMSSKPQALASIGPMRAFAANSKKISTELIEINEDLMEFNKHLTEYYKQLADTWTDAQKKVNLKAPEIPQDIEQMEAVKRIWIDIFDNDFTELFDSGKFGDNYGKLVSKELELTKHWNNITNVILQSVNLPSKEEIDEVYKEIHSLKKRVAKLELELKKKEMKKNAK